MKCEECYVNDDVTLYNVESCRGMLRSSSLVWSASYSIKPLDQNRMEGVYSTTRFHTRIAAFIVASNSRTRHHCAVRGIPRPT